MSDVASSDVCLVVDIDETILNPLARWAERINQHLGLNIDLAQVERAGGWDNFMMDRPEYATFAVFADSLRADPDFNSGLDPIDGAADALRTLCQLPNVRLGCYLTTRPTGVVDSTAGDLRRHGFPVAQIIARPPDVDRADTVEWKVSELERLLKDEPGSVVVIDDNLALGRRLLERNEHAERPIISIVFLGPLTVSEVRSEGISSQPEAHFYVAEWNDIIEIVKTYAASGSRASSLKSG
jgi:hypothetical protein